MIFLRAKTYKLSRTYQINHYLYKDYRQVLLSSAILEQWNLTKSARFVSPTHSPLAQVHPS